MKRLVYVTHQFPVVTETFTINEVKSLREHGLEVDVRALRASPPDLPDELAPLVGQSSVVGRTASLRGLRFAGSLVSTRAPRRALGISRGLALAGDLHADRDHVHAQFPLEAATAAYYGAVAGGSSFSFSGHTLHQLDLMPQKLARATFVTVGSEFERNVLSERYGAQHRERIHVRRLGVPPRPARDSAEPGLIVTAGTLSGKKGHDVLLRAVAQTDGDVRLELVGDGPLRAELEALAKTLGIDDRVTFHGARGYSETLATIGRASVFALCCRETPDGDHDCLPVALMDAMSLGVPVVTSRAFGIPELVEDGRSGLLAPPEDPEATAAGLSRLISDEAFGSAVGTAGREVVRRRFDLESNTRALTQLFADYLG